MFFSGDVVLEKGETCYLGYGMITEELRENYDAIETMRIITYKNTLR